MCGRLSTGRGEGHIGILMHAAHFPKTARNAIIACGIKDIHAIDVGKS